ncbi:MAG: glycosyl transferase family 1 [Peptococcaceae bacterium BRH_c4a]|nr:MAG: glycosyl transferase family 1 [Peptococcaceae bacterium BRH_c4a]
MANGYLALVLHAHLPFVRHPEVDDFLEERWLFESCSECYIPLLWSFERLVGEGVNFRLTLSLSPTLLSMLTDDLLKEKYSAYLDRMIELGVAETERTKNNRDINNLSVKYLRHLENVRRYFLGSGGNLWLKFRDLSDKGGLELITTAATHGFLPLVHSREGRRAQIEVGLGLFEKLFGRLPPGFWLPECAYDKGIDDLLKDAGVKYFMADTHGLLSSVPEPECGIYSPVRCRSGLAVFGRDPESSRQVWERRMGYPGHPAYREFYRDIAHDLEGEYLRPYLPDGKIRVDTGYKYYRITGGEDHKEVYNPHRALRIAEIHAMDFVRSRALQFQKASGRMERTPLVLAPYDAELFGHWWHEGPVWLENVLRLADSVGGIKTISPGDYLSVYPDSQMADLPMSSWGEGGFSYVWLNPRNDWIYKHQHVAESRMTEMANIYRSPGGVERRALNQAGRELLLAQSSDWAFILKEETTVGYATERVTGHLKNFLTLSGQIESESVDTAFLNQLESKNNIFPDLDYTVFRSVRVCPVLFSHSKMRVIMLSWEYPPRTVGGLGRHVYDLSRALSQLGIEVHVFTCPARGEPLYAVDDTGVCVHRVDQKELQAADFLEWLKCLNSGMVRLVEETGLSGGYYSLVHAHDWLVRDAARDIAEKSGLPLVVTIHATEYGRNRGIFTDLQSQIHGAERDLVSRADGLICCSQYMAREVLRLFGEAPGGIRIIPNGVDVKNLVVKYEAVEQMTGRCPKIMFLGRLVPEKGVQVLIEALPMIKGKHPGAVLTVAGKGPYEEDLRNLAHRLGVSDSVDFIGFVNDEGRNRLLAESSVAVFPSTYEPFGIVALEAMAAGIPVVVSETGGLAEIISHGIDGIKVPPGRADILARYVTEILDDPRHAENLRKNAYNKVLGQYSWKQIASDTARVYLDVVNKSKKRETCA